MEQTNISRNHLLNLLTDKEYPSPLLQKEAVEEISHKITDIVYSSLKQTSSASSAKRGHLLRFINFTCQTPELHQTEDNHLIYIKQYEKEFCDSDTQERHTPDVYSEVINFCERRKRHRKDVAKRWEFIKRMDLEGSRKAKSVAVYETNQGLIERLLKVERAPLPAQRDRSKNVEFVYALLNFNTDGSSRRVINHILDKLLLEDTLLKIELDLLEYLWQRDDEFRNIIAKKFPFILDRMVIRFCREMLKLNGSSEAAQYFLSLNNDPVILRLQKTCSEDTGLHCRLKNLIFELYVFSYCNENIYKFSNNII